MIGINNKPFIVIDHLIDVEKLKVLHDEICLGLAKSTGTLSPGNGLSRGDVALDLYNHDFLDVGYAEAKLTIEDKEVYKTLSYDEKSKFLMIKYGAYYPWGYCVSLLSNATWANKMDAKDKFIKPDIQKKFPNTLKFIYDLPFFEEIGRISIFGVLPNHHIPCHRDYDPDKWNKTDDLIMFTPVLNKPLFIYDNINKAKHHVSNHAIIFNDCDYHGVDPVPYFTYNFRIDGKFTKEFKNTILI